jgi:hypothetical protein
MTTGHAWKKTRSGTLVGLVARLSTAEVGGRAGAAMSHMVLSEAVEAEADQVGRHLAGANRRLDHHTHLGMALLLVRHLLPPLINGARRGITGTTRMGCVSGSHEARPRSQPRRVQDALRSNGFPFATKGQGGLPIANDWGLNLRARLREGKDWAETKPVQQLARGPGGACVGGPERFNERVECGCRSRGSCWQGGRAALIALAARRWGAGRGVGRHLQLPDQKRLLLFTTFRLQSTSCFQDTQTHKVG